MREFFKGGCILVLFVAGVAAALAWADDRPNQFTWGWRYGSIAAAVLAVAGFLIVHFQQDEVPDFLYERCGEFFDRGGFCFSVAPQDRDGVCVLEVSFQNRHERPCAAHLALRPANRLFLAIPMEPVTCKVDCGRAAFGIARIPFGVPIALQGKRQLFQVGASVDYPHGKGRAVRFRDGLVIRHTAQFRHPVGAALTLLGMLGGSFFRWKPATVALELPLNVAEEVPENVTPDIETLWELGDPLRPVA
ncbi:MAG: hypothetical protein WD847_06980 [Pirellulales bacterium]